MITPPILQLFCCRHEEGWRRGRPGPWDRRPDSCPVERLGAGRPPSQSHRQIAYQGAGPGLGKPHVRPVASNLRLQGPCPERESWTSSPVVTMPTTAATYLKIINGERYGRC